MRPLVHPSLDDVSVAGILYALSDPVRLSIVLALLDRDGSSCTETNERLALDMPKSTCSQHYRILREAGLVRSERRGVELISRVRADELEARFPGLLDSILRAHAEETRRARRAARR